MIKTVIASLIIAFAASVNCFAQRDSTIYFSAEFGLSTALGKELNRVYDFGPKLGLSVSIPVSRSKLRMGPDLSVYNFRNNYNEAIKDNLIFGTLGAFFELNPKSTGKAKVVPRASLFYLLGGNQLAPRDNYSGDKINMYRFNGLGFGLGLKMIFTNHLYLNLNYQMVKADGKVQDDLKEEILDGLDLNDPLYQVVKFPKTKFSFDNLSFTLGYNVQ
jgi:hypothetical protein